MATTVSTKANATFEDKLSGLARLITMVAFNRRSGRVLFPTYLLAIYSLAHTNLALVVVVSYTTVSLALSMFRAQYSKNLSVKFPLKDQPKSMRHVIVQAAPQALLSVAVVTVVAMVSPLAYQVLIVAVLFLRAALLFAATKFAAVSIKEMATMRRSDPQRAAEWDATIRARQLDHDHPLF